MPEFRYNDTPVMILSCRSCDQQCATGGNTPEDAPQPPHLLRQIILVGSPNVGKSVVFNCLTGAGVTVSNYPGTTVEVAQAPMRRNSAHITVLDTPGVNSILPRSEDERVTYRILSDILEPGITVIQVADAKNLTRALMITSQLADMEQCCVLCLNMQDEADAVGVKIDHAHLEQLLGIPVIPTVATQWRGVSRLKEAVHRASIPMLAVSYSPSLAAALAAIEEHIPQETRGKRALAIGFLSENEEVAQRLHGIVGEACWTDLVALRREIQASHREPLSYLLSQDRQCFIQAIVSQVVSQAEPVKPSWTDRLGMAMIHPVWGFPIVLLVLYLVYLVVGQFGAGTCVDFLEGTVFGHYINPVARVFCERFVPSSLITDFLVGEYGAITMALSYGLAIVLPIVTTFFIVFGVLEDTGYLPRLSVMLNQVFRIIGLNGKAVLPMVLGLGCDTMATMTTRILTTRKERILVTLLLALGIPCSAQLGVILAMMSRLTFWGMLVWAGTVVIVMVVVGAIAAAILPGKRSEFILELPPVRLPQVTNIALKTFSRIKWYLREVLPLFILGTAILFVLDRTHALPWIENAARPVVTHFMGLPPEAVHAFLIGFLRRDYGAAGLFQLANQGRLDHIQIVVSMVTITLFIPCIANFFMILKEQGIRIALLIAAFVLPFAFLVGGLINQVLRIVQLPL